MRGGPDNVVGNGVGKFSWFLFTDLLKSNKTNSSS